MNIQIKGSCQTAELHEEYLLLSLLLSIINREFKFLDFGICPIGVTQRRTIHIKNYGSYPIHLVITPPVAINV